jgi:hypothetical protein
MLLRERYAELAHRTIDLDDSRPLTEKAQAEHITSAPPSDNGRSHAARNAALASSRLSATPPFGRPAVPAFLAIPSIGML